MDTIVEHKGFGTRMKNSVGGIFAGILLLLIGIGILIFNEVNSVKNLKKVKELRENYVEIKSDTVNKDYDGKLVVTNGVLDYNNQELTDDTFNIKIKTPIIERKVEMYQWKEEKTETDEETRYEYVKAWYSDIIDSNDFKDAANHKNPTTMPYNSGSKKADSLKVGAYKLSDSIQNQVRTNKTYADLEGATIPEGYTVKNQYITTTTNMDSPNIGDIRISFGYGDYNEVSVMGKLSNDVIGDYKTSNGKVVSVFEEGTKTGEELIDEIATSDSILRWVLRLVGTLLIVGGIASFFSIIRTISSFVPILGNLVNGAIGLISLLIGLAISFFVIAVTWVVVRPVIGIALLVVVGLIIFLLIKLFGKKKEPVQTVQGQQPVLQPVPGQQPQAFQQQPIQSMGQTIQPQQEDPNGQNNPNIQQ